MYAAQPLIVDTKTGAGNKGLNAALLPAITGYFLAVAQLIFIHPRQRIVAPLASIAVATDARFPVDGHTRARPGADDHGKHQRLSGSRPINRFRHGQAVSIVGDAHFPVQRLSQIFIQRLAVEPGGVGIFHPLTEGRKRARDPKADCTGLAGFLLRQCDQIDNCLHRCLIVITRGIHTMAEQLLSLVRQCNHFCLGATQIYAYAQGYVLVIHSGERYSRRRLP